MIVPLRFLSPDCGICKFYEQFSTLPYFTLFSIPAKMEREVKLISGMVFKTLEEAKDQIRNYLVQNHITAKVIKSERLNTTLDV